MALMIIKIMASSIVILNRSNFMGCVLMGKLIYSSLSAGFFNLKIRKYLKLQIINIQLYINFQTTTNVCKRM